MENLNALVQYINICVCIDIKVYLYKKIITFKEFQLKSLIELNKTNHVHFKTFYLNIN